MFEAVELGRRLSKRAFAERAAELRVRLLELQRALRASDVPVVVVVSGVEGAGKGEVVNRLSEWLDTRGLQTHTFWDETDEERARPYAWRFWRRLPPRGTIGVFFGSWYSRPIIDRAFERIDDAELVRRMHRVVQFERMLVDDGALVVKMWFHISESTQKARVELANERAKAWAKGAVSDRSWKISPLAKKYGKRYAEFVRVSENAIRRTDTGVAAWHVIEATDPHYRDYTAGAILADALADRLGRAERAGRSANVPPPQFVPSSADLEQPTVLDRVDLTARLDKSRYERELVELQREYFDLTWKAWKAGRPSVVLFEGWDAAGKGGAIRKLAQAVDARLFRTIPVAAPTDEERAQHYLWRFWRHLPRDGMIRIYDRSWYGRVLVERVEGLATPDEWLRAYGEINDFEEQLVEHGVVLTKLWLHLSRDEQLRRFEERKQTAHKMHKITDEDWRNRDKWADYEAAVNDMVTRTSTSFAPWNLVAGEQKRWARVEVLRCAVRDLRAALEGRAPLG